LIRLVLQGHPLWGYPGGNNQRGEGLDHPQSPVEEPLRGPEARVRHRETDQQENLRLGVPSARRSPRVDPRRSPQRPTGTNSRWENLRDQLVKSCVAVVDEVLEQSQVLVQATTFGLDREVLRPRN
jgi:hypothetical protein